MEHLTAYAGLLGVLPLFHLCGEFIQYLLLAGILHLLPELCDETIHVICGELAVLIFGDDGADLCQLGLYRSGIRRPAERFAAFPAAFFAALTAALLSVPDIFFLNPD